MKTPLTYIINKSFETGVYAELIQSKVKPIFKSGDQNYCHNYRPISIISTISKICENII